MRYCQIIEAASIFPIPATPENIAKAKEFVFRKWQERAKENGYSVNDLSSSCKFTSLFAQQVFGGEIRGNEHHQHVVLNNKVIDLNDDAADVRKLSLSMPFYLYQHDKRFWKNKDHRASMDSCRPRVKQWVEEFEKELTQKS